MKKKITKLLIYLKIKPLNIRLLKRRKSKTDSTIGEKIGRVRRFNSCQLDYKRNNLIQRNINIEEDDDEVRIFLPMPPTTF